MSPLRILAIVLIVGGVLALAYGSFTYTSGSHDLDLGVMELSVKDRDTVNVPVWAGVAAVAAGVLLFVVRRRG